ncbi:hypothetical protein SS50377_24587 [Spironucleus salmonicida]|uniref:Uncharacterized protein n=1 Tax=Spironucleus salmonicida TaxID=348837 RepID=A0A9P8LQS4_9EUKA|nr:hypothetical protein SS50377_24587 [Spironucleus salmonicida]
MNRYYASSVYNDMVYIGTFNITNQNFIQVYRINLITSSLKLIQQVKINLPVIQIRAFNNFVFISTDCIKLYDNKLVLIKEYFSDNLFPILDFSVVFTNTNYYELCALSHGQILIANESHQSYLKVIRQNWCAFHPFSISNSSKYYLLFYTTEQDVQLIFLNEFGQNFKTDKIQLQGRFIQLERVEKIRIDEAYCLYCLTSEGLFYLEIKVIRNLPQVEIINMNFPIINQLNGFVPTADAFLCITDSNFYEVIDDEVLIIQKQVEVNHVLNSLQYVSNHIILIGDDFLKLKKVNLQ